jgi:hypothetical protein
MGWRRRDDEGIVGWEDREGEYAFFIVLILF